MLLIRKHNYDELFKMLNWIGRRTVHGRGGMAQLVEHIVYIDGANEGNVSPVGSVEDK